MRVSWASSSYGDNNIVHAIQNSGRKCDFNSAKTIAPFPGVWGPIFLVVEFLMIGEPMLLVMMMIASESMFSPARP